LQLQGQQQGQQQLQAPRPGVQTPEPQRLGHQRLRSPLNPSLLVSVSLWVLVLMCPCLSVLTCVSMYCAHGTQPPHPIDQAIRVPPDATPARNPTSSTRASTVCVASPHEQQQQCW
jgi:hypothetical protein